MILSDKTIKEYLEKKYIEVSPLEDYQIQPASIDLRLDQRLLIIDDIQSNHQIDFEQPIRYKERQQNFLRPGEFALASTIEYIKLPDFISARVYGRSSIGRSGLTVENSSWVDPLFEGQITLELHNFSHTLMKLPPNLRVCQIVFDELTEPCENGYNGKYVGQIGATGSRIHMDVER